MNDKLVEKPITLNYAVEMGWNLTDAVYAQLVERGAETQYTIQGIYSDSGSMFVILQDVSTLEYAKATLEITADNTVALGTEFVAVELNWTTKTPEDDTKVEPIADVGTVKASTKPNAQKRGAYSAAGDGDGDGDGAGEGEGDGAGNDEGADDGAEPAAEPAGDPAEPTGDPAEEPAAEPTGDPAEEPAGDPAEPVEDNPTINELGEIIAAKTDPETAELMALREKAENLEKEITERLATLKEEIAQKDAKIVELEGALNQYRMRDAEAEEAAKNEMIASYKSLLTEEEMKPITDKLSEFSLDEVEAKLSVTYTRKQRSTVAPQQNEFQVNIGSLGETMEDDMPEFMRQAAEYDRAHGLNFNI